jgi:hypothetical protein
LPLRDFTRILAYMASRTGLTMIAAFGSLAMCLSTMGAANAAGPDQPGQT